MSQDPSQQSAHGGPAGSTPEPATPDMNRTTGPVPVTPPPAGQHGQPGQPGRNDAWWQAPQASARPDQGGWSAPTWGQQTGQPHDTRTFPAAGPGYVPPNYQAPVGQHAGAPTGTAVLDRPKRSRTGVIVAGTTALALLAGFGGGYLGANLNSPSTSTAAATSSLNTTPASINVPAGNQSVQTVADAVLPSVVSIMATFPSGSGEGSGVVLSSDGQILTNAHVVKSATDIEVRFNDGTTAPAELVGIDASDDIAVIKVSGVSNLTPAKLGDSGNLKVGQDVVAIGSPLGLSATVTSGIVSALNRPVQTQSADTQDQQQWPGLQQQQQQPTQDTIINAVQTDAAINPGNSGGALVDMNGNVIGINSAIASLSASGSGESGNIGVGFAIPINQAKRIAQELIDNGKATRAVFGASVGDATGSNSSIPTGAKLGQITSGGGAEAAGLQAGDVVTKIGDVPVESAAALIAQVRSQAPGSTVAVTYERDGKSETANVTLGSAAAS
ncbi:PDZ domain-containing protein [Nakamurella flava]|uniref:PDZ domain-containing protein n=1 Tax=Nakamurella flava TaxID=2576308 RepID=A0A4U6QAJ7_9ACTN|nr:trypsin-like peptidase domain-containing protein [Nakamurella flava]TKV56939.1 PDZ domain-containing protein [Nakamurella flava]